MSLAGFVPSYNMDACKLFDYISLHTNTNIQHGANGGEFHIEHLGYWVDGYDAENNIVYEYDEKHHFVNESIISRDKARQLEIMDHLKCLFIRIKYDTPNNVVLNEVKRLTDIHK